MKLSIKMMLLFSVMMLLALLILSSYAANFSIQGANAFTQARFSNMSSSISWNMKQDYSGQYQDKLRTIPEALATIHSGDCIFTTNNYSEPAGFLSELHTIAPNVEGVKVWKGRSGE